LIGSDTATATGITAVAYAPVLELCRQLLAADYEPTTALHAYRGGVLTLKVRSIGEAAELAVQNDKNGTPSLRRWRNRAPGGGTASPIAWNGAGVSYTGPSESKGAALLDTRNKVIPSVADLLTFMAKRRLALTDLIEVGAEDRASLDLKTREKVHHVAMARQRMARLGVSFADLEEAAS
jgi:hypothetical protein